MFDPGKLIENLHYDGTRDYTKVRGDVAYLDGKRLGRPADMPKAQRNVLRIFVILAIIIGLAIIYFFVVEPYRASLTIEETVAQNTARAASLDTIPVMSDYITMSDEQIQADVANKGYSFYDATSLTESGNMMLVKIPGDMTIDQVGSMYLRGINSLSAADATLFLCGSWVLSVDRINTTSMVVHYADFSTGDPQQAVDNAFAHEGFKKEQVTESGKDDSDNTFTQGTIETDGVQSTWKISALPLTDMYSIHNLPEDACYVGIRITKIPS